MVTESPMTAMPDIGIIGDGFNGEDFEKELGLLLREQRRQEAIVSERELNLYRSGSAPPTVEGSMAAIGGIYRGDSIAGVMEDELRSDPAYLTYYYSNANLNPRLPPPVLSKEDWRSSQRIKPGGIESRRRNGGFEEQASSSLFSMQPDERRNSGEWFDTGGDGVVGMPGFEIGRKKSYAELFQDDLGRTTPVSSYPSRPSSRNSLFGNGIEPLGSSEVHLSLNHEIGSLDSLQPGGNIQSITGLQSNGKSTTQLVTRTPSPGLPPVGVRIGDNDKRSNNGSSSFSRVSSGIIDSNDLVATLSGMSLSSNGGLDEDITQHQHHHKFLFDSQIAPNQVKQHPFLKNTDPVHLNPPSYPDLTRKTGGLLGLNNSAMGPNSHIGLTHESSNSFLKETTLSNGAFTNYGPSGYSPNPALSSMMANQIGTGTFPPLFENAAAASVIGSPGLDSRALNAFPSGSNFSGASDLHNLNMFGDHGTSAALQMPVLDPLYIQYLRTAEYEAQLAGQYSDPPMERGYMGNSYVDLLGIQKVYLEALLQQQKAYGMPYIGKSGGFGNGYYANPAFGFGMPYPGSPLASPVLPASPVGPGTPIRHGERNLNFPSGLRNFTGGAMRSWHSDSTGHLDGIFPPSLLEEFKNNKTRCYELSEIAGHIVEFSADQYGSRFIQQKLETATSEEKNMVFEEIMSQAFSLMTDVFGNYVIQKFFEHGSSGQRRELAEQLSGQVLTLSLQMYGCRVIQKAIEVVGLDQQTKMVAELDGHVMRCVRDQNGNHVIQKCIECVPQDAIQFIISSFYDQVVTLSTHPYGCRVIQRVLEHCDDLKTQQIMMDEIMGSVNMLAQDQYGNYVVQHILEHGKPHERSTVIKKLAGQIVQMSQQKFASNVVEKCLIFGGLVERQIIVNEMLGTTDENEPLQAMMKDQFANYVVQKVLETCDDHQRELILSRIKVHLNALKKYTYGKHIVARVEKLVAAGERRSGIQSSYTS